MRLRFFSVTLHSPAEAEQELNRFLAGHRILAIDQGGAEPVSRAPTGKRAKVDFKDVLGPDEFAVFARLTGPPQRAGRRGRVPAYAVFTNDQLADMVRRRLASAAALGEIPGIGDGRVEKHGEAFLRVPTEAALPAAVTADDETLQGPPESGPFAPGQFSPVRPDPS